jgi:beta-glucosidase/6-phospho-beta-glucosidase/beta-galactosidase
MIRQVAYAKAILAGALGALAWAGLSLALAFSGAPVPDMVDPVGAVALPGGAPWARWGVGLLLHVAVGALWGLFYAYFFFSLLPVRPVLQGMAFSVGPMLLALLVLRPQLRLMLMEGVEAGRLLRPTLSPFDEAVGVPLALAVGHLVWGAVLGAVYTRPVGYASHRPPALPAPPLPAPPLAAPEVIVPREAAAPEDRFMFATGIECSYPTIEGGRWRMDQMAACDHYRRWREDLGLVREMGLRHLRYGPPVHLMFRGPGRYDWGFMDAVAAEMRRLGIVPMIDLVHFGVPDWLENFQNPELAPALAEFAGAFARRYPWVKLYTPVNEMYVCTKLSALEGVWNEQRRDERSFVTAVRHVAKAGVLMAQAIRAARPDAIFINSESGEFYQPCCPEPEVMRIAEFENERRFLPLDLLYGHPVSDGMRGYLREHGMPDDEYAWFMQQDAKHRAILGVDYYVWNEKLIDTNGRAQTLGELFGWYVVAQQYYERYRMPLMHTETNHQDAREGPRWLWRQWHNVQLLRQSGVPIVGFTWYSLTDQVDWDVGLSAARGNVNPVGLFDLNRDPRLVGQSYRHMARIFGADLARDPTLEQVLADAARGHMVAPPDAGAAVGGEPDAEHAGARRTSQGREDGAC